MASAVCGTCGTRGRRRHGDHRCRVRMHRCGVRSLSSGTVSSGRSIPGCTSDWPKPSINPVPLAPSMTTTTRTTSTTHRYSCGGSQGGGRSMRSRRTRRLSRSAWSPSNPSVDASLGTGNFRLQAERIGNDWFVVAQSLASVDRSSRMCCYSRPLPGRCSSPRSSSGLAHWSQGSQPRGTSSSTSTRVLGRCLARTPHAAERHRG